MVFDPQNTLPKKDVLNRDKLIFSIAKKRFLAFLEGI